MAIKTRKHLHPWWVAEVLNPCDRQPLQTWAETMSAVSWRESELLLTQNLPSFIEVQRLGEAATKKNDPQSKRKKSAADPMLIGVDLLAFSTLLATLAIYKPRTVRVLWSLTGAWKISLGFCPRFIPSAKWPTCSLAVEYHASTSLLGCRFWREPPLVFTGCTQHLGWLIFRSCKKSTHHSFH